METGGDTMCPNDQPVALIQSKECSRNGATFEIAHSL
jgi:RNA polymerase sigma-70 factor, ECF subfamily